jgi:N,N-dimethylformamidase
MANYNTLKGSVASAFTCSPISGVEINLLDSNGEIVGSTFSDKKGQWSININVNVSKAVFKKTHYVTKSLDLNKDFSRNIRLLEDTTIGYLDKLWYRPGETLKAYIHSTEPFRAHLIRHGIKSELVMELGEYQPIVQTVPNDYFVTNGLSWSQPITYILPDNLDSGLYTINLRTNISSQNYSMTFVLSPSIDNCGKNSRILVLASTNNWQTYNIWGGRSRYRNFENSHSNKLIDKLMVLGLRFIPESIKTLIKKSLKGRAVVTIKDHPDNFQFKRLSIKRPHPNCSIDGESAESVFTSHLAAGEWRVLAWLEREGYKYDLISGFQLHNNPEILKAYDVLILSTHCEYWTKEMFKGLEDFYKAGGSLLNLSGNSIYREVEFFEDGSLQCISLRFADSAQDESKLIGVRFDMRGYGSCAPYKVIRPAHWAFDGTNLKKDDLFAKESLNNFRSNSSKNFDLDPASNPGMAPLTGNGGSGWETDKITQSAPDDIVLLAKGTNKRNGGADMIIRESPSGNLMFSASSITFGGVLLIDSSSSILVNNILKKALRKADVS